MLFKFHIGNFFDGFLELRFITWGHQRFLGQVCIVMGTCDGVERGWECEAVCGVKLTVSIKHVTQ